MYEINFLQIVHFDNYVIIKVLGIISKVRLNVENLVLVNIQVVHHHIDLKVYLKLVHFGIEKDQDIQESIRILHLVLFEG